MAPGPVSFSVVDDGSTDGTSEVARRFGGTVRCISQENARPAAARNCGIREARGEFVAFLDADDHWLATALIDVEPRLRRVMG